MNVVKRRDEGCRGGEIKVVERRDEGCRGGERRL